MVLFVTKCHDRKGIRVRCAELFELTGLYPMHFLSFRESSALCQVCSSVDDAPARRLAILTTGRASSPAPTTTSLAGGFKQSTNVFSEGFSSALVTSSEDRISLLKTISPAYESTVTTDWHLCCR